MADGSRTDLVCHSCEYTGKHFFKKGTYICDCACHKAREFLASKPSPKKKTKKAA